MEIGTTSIQFPGNKNASISGREIETDAGIATGKQPEENSNEGTHYTAVDSGQDSAQSNHEEDISQAVNVTSTEQPMKNGESASSTNNSNVGTDAAADNTSAVTEEVFEEKEEVHASVRYVGQGVFEKVSGWEQRHLANESQSYAGHDGPHHEQPDGLVKPHERYFLLLVVRVLCQLHQPHAT